VSFQGAVKVDPVVDHTVAERDAVRLPVKAQVERMPYSPRSSSSLAPVSFIPLSLRRSSRLISSAPVDAGHGGDSAKGS